MGKIELEYSKDDMERYLEAFKETAPQIQKACRKAGFRKLGYATIARWRAEAPWFAEAMDDILHDLFDSIEEQEFDRARKGKTESSRFLLMNHRIGRERGYGRRTELSGPQGKPINWAELMKEASE